MSTRLITVDVGNVGLKFRQQGGPWVSEPSLVRSAPPQGYTFTSGATPRAITYLRGPAGIPAQAVYVGSEAERSGQHDLAIVGSAEVRVRSAAYLLLHLYGILASLPPGVTEATVDFAGGLPVADAASPEVAAALRERLKGAHTLTWGDATYQITVARTLLVPQPIGAIATALFSVDGKVRTNGALERTRFVLDVGGGTTDYTGRRGLELIPGTEGGLRLGVVDAAQRACDLIQARYPRLRELSARRVLLAMQGGNVLGYQGDPLSVAAEVEAGIGQTAAAIVAEVLPRWERVLAQGEVLVCGGGGALMARAFQRELGAITRVELLDGPIFRVADGLERLARNKLQA